ncbi:putative methyltransferase-like C25B8.10 [Ceratocystis lukuohia]|uniref:Methyltransferase-like C25B8.10 n=1 Tax=Ceratocystis lukuohia TaxID=2019550 RepID=A0ABR4MCI6_9PEZI
MAEAKIHSSAVVGFTDGKSYDDFRPSYVEEAVSGLLAGLNLIGAEGAAVVEVAAGTGKFTESLARRPEAFRITAIEPVEGMREQLDKKKLPNVVSLEGTANEIKAETGSADAVIAAQSYHWFAKRDAMSEFARVLKPDGFLGVIWNVEDYNKPAEWPAVTEWEEELNKLILALPPDNQDRFRQLSWRNGFSPAENTSSDGVQLFRTPYNEAQSAVWSTRLTPEKLLDRISTLSQVVALEGLARQEWIQKYWAVLKTAETAQDGTVEVHGKTFYAWSQKMPGQSSKEEKKEKKKKVANAA